MGCLTRLGCLAVAAIGAAAAYTLYGDRVPATFTRAAKTAATTVGDQVVKGAKSVRVPRSLDIDSARGVVWANVDDAPVGNIASLRTLSTKRGPAFVNVSPREVTGILAIGLSRGLPRSASHVQLAVLDSNVIIRAVVDLSDLGGDGAFGAILGTAVTGRDTMRLAGALSVVRPGVGDYRVRGIRLKGVNLPSPMIPAVLRQFARREPGDSVPPDVLRFAIPRTIADVRVSNSQVTLYKAVR